MFKTYLKKCFYYLALVSLSFLILSADENKEKESNEKKESKETEAKNREESLVKELKEGWIFSFEEDLDSNRFPDNWRRSKNYKLADGKTLAFASWAEVKLDSKIKKEGKYSLHILFQGFHPVGLETAIFKVDNFSAYELSSWVNLDPATTTRSQVIMGIYWYDKEYNQLPQQTEDRFTVENTSGWELQKQRINSINKQAVYARIYIRVEGDDKEAKIWIDETRFSKRPKISIESNKFLNMFDENELFSLNVNIRGLEKGNYTLNLNMLNVHKEIVYSTTKTLTVSESDLLQKKENNIPIDLIDKYSYIDKIKPEKNRLMKGAYTANITLQNDKEEVGGNTICIGRTNIQKRERIKDDGEVFGITIDSIENTYKLRKGLDLMNILRVKIPVWNLNLEWVDNQFKNDQGPIQLAEIVKEIKSGENQPEIIGVFAPRPKVIENVAEKGILNLVNADEKIWKPYFENPIYNLRTSIKVWQLGDDHDGSFTNDERQQLALEKLNSLLEKAGQVGSATKILTNTIIPNRELLLHRWLMFNDFEYTDDLNFDDVEKAMSNDKVSFSVKKWITIPIKSKLLFRSDLEPAIDIFKKIVWSRKNNVKRIFVSKYQDEFSGLINQKNEITPALLAYKLCVEKFSEVTYLGSLPEFGNEIENFVFSLNNNPKKAILVAWSKRSDNINKNYEFQEDKLTRINKKFEDLIVELKQPDAILGHQLIEFFPDINFEKTKSHFAKGLNNIINTPQIRKSFLNKYMALNKLSKSPSLQDLINNKYKKEDEEKETTRYILEEIYPLNLNHIETVQKNILLDQDIEQIDLMGNSILVPIKYFEGDPYQEIKITQLPTIYSGLSSDFINTRITIRLDKNYPLYSRLEKQKQVIIIKNNFDQPMEGIFILNYPVSWKNFNPFVPIRLEKGQEERFEFYIIPSRIATPGPITIGLKTTFNTDRKYSFRSERIANLDSELIVGKPGEKIAVVPPKFGDSTGRHLLNIPISMKAIPGRPTDINVLVKLLLPNGDTQHVRLDKVQVGTFRMAPFYFKLNKDFNNKSATIRIEQIGSNNESLIFHNLNVPIPDAE